MKKGYAINGYPDPEQKRCFDCKFCEGSISWWCINEEASNARGTKIPGVKNCPFWEPIPTKKELIEEQNNHRSKWSRKLLGDRIKGDWIEVDCKDNPKIQNILTRSILSKIEHLKEK